MGTELNISPTYLHEQFGDAVISDRSDGLGMNSSAPMITNQFAKAVINPQTTLPENNFSPMGAVSKIQTDSAGVFGRSTDAGLVLNEPMPTSGISELCGACQSLCSEVAERVTPNVQAKLDPVVAVPLDQKPPVPIAPIHNLKPDTMMG